MRCRDTLVVLLVMGPIAQAGDWPQWLGPNRDGASSEKVDPWKEAPDKVWSVPVGEGYSVPVVAGGRVFVHARVSGKEAEELIALDAKTGKEAWRTSYRRAPYSSLLNTGPQGTPCVSRGKIFTFGITGVLTCFEVDSGKQV